MSTMLEAMEGNPEMRANFLKCVQEKMELAAEHRCESHGGYPDQVVIVANAHIVTGGGSEGGKLRVFEWDDLEALWERALKLEQSTSMDFDSCLGEVGLI